MVKLIPFSSASGLPAVEASVELIKNDLIELSFDMPEIKNISGLPFSISNETKWARTNDLWKKTCFELFISKPNSDSYWEFNFSPNGNWNSYFFTDYRNPQPPQVDQNWKISKCESSTNRFSVTVTSPRESFNEFEASICAVICLNDSSVHYYSHKHFGDKPDFHLRTSMSLKRSSK